MTANKKDLYNLVDGWLELESDPGLFTLLLEDMGVVGVQVEEIYDLQREPLVENKTCYGAIFLFRWIEERRSRRKLLDEEELYVRSEEEVNKIFFAYQMIPNSCATHALVSILLNCPELELGATLSNLRNHVAGMSPENKGLAIGNCPELAHAHNSHAVPRVRRRFERNNMPTAGSRYTGETFHFVSYVPINGRLFELDGLKKFPIDHGPIPEGVNWTEKLRSVITERLGIATGGVPYHDIRFALMTVVPDTRYSRSKKLYMLKLNREIVIKALRQLLQLYHEKKVKLSLPLIKDEPPEELMVNEDEEECYVMKDSTGATPEAKRLQEDVQKAMDEDSELISSVAASARRSSSQQPRPFNKPLLRLSRGSSVDSQPPRSPFQSNPLLTAHDYAKSPLMEGCPEPPPPTSISETADDSGNPTRSNSSLSSKIEDTVISSEENSNSSSKVERAEDGMDCSEVAAVAGGDDTKAGAEEEDSKVYNRATSEEELTGVAEEVSDTVVEMTKEGTEGSSSDRIVDPEANTSQDKLAPPSQVEFDPESARLKEPYDLSPRDLLQLLRRIETDIHVTEANIRDDVEKHKKYRIDDCRRVHNYDEFITTFLTMLAEQNLLADLVQHGMGYKRQGEPAAAKEAVGSGGTSSSSSNGATSTGGTGTKKNGGGGKIEQPTAAATASTAVAPPARSRKKKKKYAESESDWSDDDLLIPVAPRGPPQVLYTDPTLPKGWKRKVKKRGMHVPGAGKYDVVIISPAGRSFKNRAELRAYLEKEESELKVENFDFSVAGVKRSKKKKQIK